MMWQRRSCDRKWWCLWSHVHQVPDEKLTMRWRYNTWPCGMLLSSLHPLVVHCMERCHWRSFPLCVTACRVRSTSGPEDTEQMFARTCLPCHMTVGLKPNFYSCVKCSTSPETLVSGSSPARLQLHEIFCYFVRHSVEGCDFSGITFPCFTWHLIYFLH